MHAEASDLPLYPGIALADIVLLDSAERASSAAEALLHADVLGFDTESKPTFAKGETSTGPHLIQLATDSRAYLFPVTSGTVPVLVRQLLEAPHILKVGFGLGDDVRRLQAKLGIQTQQVLDLAVALREDKRGDVGAKMAVARFFGQRLQKSKKISTSNWSNPRLSEAQLRYAANDAHVALRVYRAWRAGSGTQGVHPDEQRLPL